MVAARRRHTEIWIPGGAGRGYGHRDSHTMRRRTVQIARRHNGRLRVPIREARVRCTKHTARSSVSAPLIVAADVPAHRSGWRHWLAAAAGRRVPDRGVADDRMPWGHDGAAGPHTIRAYLRPVRHWAYSLHCPDIQLPHRVFSEPVDDTGDDVYVAMRFILAPADAGIVREARTLAAILQAERRQSPSGPRAGIRPVAGRLRWAVGRRPPLRQLRLHAPAMETKARGHLLAMQIQLRLQAPTRAQAERGMARLVATFEAYTSWPNRLRAHRPRRGRRFDRVFSQARAWPGATFVASAEEAHAITSLPLPVLASLDERQVWTHWSDGRGTTIAASGPYAGRAPDA